MSLFDQHRLTNEIIKLDVEGLRCGYYSDKYFENVVHILGALHASDYKYAGQNPRTVPMDVSQIAVGDMVVEAQIFARRAPFALVAGVDVALAMLRHATGYDDAGTFVEAWRDLEVDAVEDGVITHYRGDPEVVQPVMKIRGRYRDFALLETPILGALTRASRVATNVYNTLLPSNGKPVLFFPARFDLPKAQSLDGYAYWLAVQRYNYDINQSMTPLVSTDAQGAWWGGRGGGTVPHALVACFLGDTAEAMLAFARYLPIQIPRIALVDFNNDCVGAALATLNAFWPHYRDAIEAGDQDEQKRWTLYGVRLDTSANTRDISLGPHDLYGVNPVLVRVVRQALNDAWQGWNVSTELKGVAQRYCRDVKIVVSGGFNAERVAQYEEAGVPADIYGVGSTFLINDSASNTDYTMDVVRIRLDGTWMDMAKVGRRPCDNVDLRSVDLTDL